MSKKGNKPETNIVNDSTEMWKATDKLGFTAKCEYLLHKHKFKVSVTKSNKTYHQLFSAAHEPKFGMDIQDLNESKELATQLADKIAKELNEETPS